MASCIQRSWSLANSISQSLRSVRLSSNELKAQPIFDIFWNCALCAGISWRAPFRVQMAVKEWL